MSQERTGGAGGRRDKVAKEFEFRVFFPETTPQERTGETKKPKSLKKRKDKDEEWLPDDKKPKPKKSRGKRKKEPSQAEKVAEEKIRRLLRDAQEEIEQHVRLVKATHASAREQGEESTGTLQEALRKWGPEKLLRLLETKICHRCKERLGLIFSRDRSGGGYYQKGTCLGTPRCFQCLGDLQEEKKRSSDWSGHQAGEGFRNADLNRLIQREYTPFRTAESGWCRGTELYDDITVSQAAVKFYDYDAWKLHYVLAKYESRRRNFA